MLDRLRKALAARTLAGVSVAAPPRKRPPNLFEAAATYVSASVEDDEDKLAEAATWVPPEALTFGINELACRAVVALARERDESPQVVARALLGLPAVG
ncbi:MULTISPECIES: hypothetical protein [unclassified Streptomyces]|uniref:hypothetical protein n=1 Tax=unclassified Streptomyces TaxID=2593676 RepID=UPI0036EB9BB6